MTAAIRPPRRLVALADIVVRRTVASGGEAGRRLRAAWRCRVFARRRAGVATAETTEIWSAAERAAMATAGREAARRMG